MVRSRRARHEPRSAVRPRPRPGGQPGPRGGRPGRRTAGQPRRRPDTRRGWPGRDRRRRDRPAPPGPRPVAGRGSFGDPGALAISAIGPLELTTGRLRRPPNLPATFADVPFAEPIGAALGLPWAIDRDTHVAALGEQAFGAARGVRDFLYLTVSTGIGGAIVADGRLVAGPDGVGGELGHVTLDLHGPPCGCGERGHLEASPRAAPSPGPRPSPSPWARRRASRLVLVASRRRRSRPATSLRPRTTGIGTRPGSWTRPGVASRSPRSAWSTCSRRSSSSSAGASPRAKASAGSSPPGAPSPRGRSPSRRARVRIVAAELGDDVGLVGAIPLVAGRLAPSA